MCLQANPQLWFKAEGVGLLLPQRNLTRYLREILALMQGLYV